MLNRASIQTTALVILCLVMTFGLSTPAFADCCIATTVIEYPSPPLIPGPIVFDFTVTCGDIDGCLEEDGTCDKEENCEIDPDDIVDGEGTVGAGSTESTVVVTTREYLPWGTVGCDENSPRIEYGESSGERWCEIEFLGTVTDVSVTLDPDQFADCIGDCWVCPIYIAVIDIVEECLSDWLSEAAEGTGTWQSALMGECPFQ